jgi:protein TonB
MHNMKFILSNMLLFCFCSTHAQTDTTKIVTTDSAVYFHTEIRAEYPGGIHAWMRYLQKNLRYPDHAVSKNIQGTVIVQFIVDSTGIVHDVSAISGPDELREESIRLIQKAGTWVPAINNGKKVNSWKRQPFSFKLETPN